MKTYLVAFSVINRLGNFMSRDYIDHDGPVTRSTIEGWETVRLYEEYEPTYGRTLSIRVTGFQSLETGERA